MNRIIFLYFCLISYYVKSFLFIKKNFKFQPLFIKKERNRPKNKYSSGCDERYDFENITEILHFKNNFSRNMEFLFLLNLLYDDSMPIFNKLFFIEENIFLENKFKQKKTTIHNNNLTMGGLLKHWDFEF